MDARIKDVVLEGGERSSALGGSSRKQNDHNRLSRGNPHNSVYRYQRIKLKWKDRYFFTEQMAMLLDAGVVMLPALELLEKNAKGRLLKLFLRILRENVVKGHSISFTLTLFKGSFTDLYIAMVRIGEESGQLPQMLIYLAQMEEARQAARQSIQKAIIYPLMVLIVAVSIVIFIMIAVVPTFESLYSSSRMELPILTQKVMAVSAFIASRQGIYFGVSVLVSIFLLKSMYRRSVTIRYSFDRFMLNTPLFGDILRHDFNAKTSDILAIMLKSGVPLVKSLTLYEASVVNSDLRNRLQGMRMALTQGQSLFHTAQSSGAFTEVFLTLVSVGEMSGGLESVLEKSGHYHRDLVERRVTLLISLIDPLSLVFIGGIVGVILIALYLPMFSMGMTL